jgi:hypothetical protein
VQVVKKLTKVFGTPRSNKRAGRTYYGFFNADRAKVETLFGPAEICKDYKGREYPRWTLDGIAVAIFGDENTVEVY